LPPIALAARVFGDVRLRITADRETGNVTDAEPITGHALHIAAAVAAARGWQFAPESIPREPIEVTVRFQLRCPAP
jgi:outer membrane biosynthesis protein TonB